MRLNPLESQLERLARTLTDRFGVTVLCRGELAYTDGRRIVLPSLPEPMDESLERMVVGYLDHEMAHVAFTDFKEVLRFTNKHKGFKDLLNAVEDALIEKRAMQRWPGVRANLDALFGQIRGRVTANVAAARPFHRFVIAVYLKLSHHRDMLGLEGEVAGFEDLLAEFPAVRSTKDAAALSSRLLDRWLKKMTSQSSQQAPGAAPPANQTPSQSAGTRPSATQATDTSTGEGSVDREAIPSASAADRQADADQGDEASATRSTHDADEGGHSDGDTNQDEAESDDHNPDEATADESAEEGASEGPCDDSDDEEHAEADPDAGVWNGDTSGEAVDSTGKAADDDAACGDETAGPGASDEQCAHPANGDSADFTGTGVAGTDGGSLIGEIIAEAIAEAMQAIDGNERYRIYTKDHDHIDVVPDAEESAVRALLAAGVDAVRRLRRGLANALRSAEKRWWREDQSRGDLSPRTLHRLCLDRASLCIFRSRAVVQGKSTAVSIALDASGSMTTSKMNVARDAMRVLLEALHDLKIPTEAFTFTTGDAFSADKAATESNVDAREIRLRFTRFTNLEIGLIKRFEDTVKIAMRRLPSIAGTGLTPIGEAMEIGARRLIVRRETRKILLILTDGHPCCEGSSLAAFNHAKHVAQQVSSAGIELVGVGITESSLCAIVEDTIVVNQIEELPAQLCKLLGRTLKKGVCHVG